MRVFKHAYALLILFLSACATTTVQLPDDYEGADAGYIVASIATSDFPGYPEFSLLYRGADQAVGQVKYRPKDILKKMPRDFEESGLTGLVVVNRVPPGDYELFGFNVQMAPNFAWINQKPLTVRFSVKPGETTYLGSYRFDPAIVSGVFGKSMQGGRFYVSDKNARDMGLAQAKGASAKLNLAVPDFLKIGNPAFRPEPDS